MATPTSSTLSILESVGAIIRGGHFVYTSGKHGHAYVNKDALYLHTGAVSDVCRKMAETQRVCTSPIDVVLAPALGGIALSQWTAHHLSDVKGYEVLAAYAERDASGTFVLKRGYDEIVRGKRVLIVEDILTTGGSVKQVVELAHRHGAHIVGVIAVCNRGNVTSTDISPSNVHCHLWSMSALSFETYEEADCPFCNADIPVNVDLGKGREFLARRNAASTVAV